MERKGAGSAGRQKGVSTHGHPLPAPYRPSLSSRASSARYGHSEAGGPLIKLRQRLVGGADDLSYTNRLMNPSAVSATSRHPLSMVRACPRFGIFTISVTAGLRLCRL
jgi:hypothetical protein